MSDGVPSFQIQPPSGATRLNDPVVGACPSPVTGAEGNREFFLHLRAGARALDEEPLGVLVAAAVLPSAEGS